MGTEQSKTYSAAGGPKCAIAGRIPEGLPLQAIQQISPHLLRSDHAPFWQKGIPAVMWTDTSEFRNPHYHKASDTPETLDYEFMAEVGKLLVGVVVVGRWHRHKRVIGTANVGQA